VSTKSREVLHIGGSSMVRLNQIAFVIRFALSCCVVAPNEAIAGDDSQITLEQIQAMTARWRASFVNIRVVYDMRSLPPLDKPLLDWSPPADPESAPRFARDEWIWADHGLDLYDNRAFYWTPGKIGYRDVDIFNGPKNLSMRVSYQKSREQVQKMKELNIQLVAGGKPTSSFSRAAMNGLYSPATAEWLPEILANREWKLDGIETVFGNSCAKVSNASMGKTEVLWLDLKHDGLPRRVQQIYGKRGNDFVVDELQQLDTGLWFPKRARIQLRSDPVENHLVVVTEAQINLSLDLSRFDPPEPVIGTAVTDGRISRTYIQGQPVIPLDSPSNAKNPLNAVGILSSERPDSNGFVWIITMICASIASLAIGLWFRRKVSRS
jgi:hypothetical protein